MTAYWIARTKFVRPMQMGEYQRLSEMAEKRFPRRTLVRGGAFQIIEGERYFDRFVIHEFPSMAAALGFYNTPEYREATALRLDACDGRAELVLVEGLGHAVVEMPFKQGQW